MLLNVQLEHLQMNLKSKGKKMKKVILAIFLIACMFYFSFPVLGQEKTSEQKFGFAMVEFEITVPADYDPSLQIDSFMAAVVISDNSFCSGDFTNKNYKNVTNTLKPGKTYRVRMFPVLDTANSEECLAFLKKQNAILVGGQGLTLIHELHEDKFIRTTFTLSFDKKEALWQDTCPERHRRIPTVYGNAAGGWGFVVCQYEGKNWTPSYSLLCVSAVE